VQKRFGRFRVSVETKFNHRRDDFAGVGNDRCLWPAPGQPAQRFGQLEGQKKIHLSWVDQGGEDAVAKTQVGGDDPAALSHAGHLALFGLQSDR